MTLLSILIGLGSLGLGAWILSIHFDALISRKARGPITVGEFRQDGASTPKLGELLQARWAYLQDPTAVEVKNAFREVATLDALQLFKEVQGRGISDLPTLTVEGVNVNAVLKIIQSITTPKRWTVEGELFSQREGMLLVLSLRHGSQRVKRWTLSRSATSDEEKKAATERLLEDALFELVFELYQVADDRPPAAAPTPAAAAPALISFRHTFAADERNRVLPNARALGAFHIGAAELSRYYRLGEPSSLDAAVAALRTLQAESPLFSDGLLLLGMALAESRREHEAIQVYDQLLSLKERNPDAPLAYDNVRLLKAMARVKLYTPQSASEAIAELKLLLDELSSPESQKTWTDKLAATEILAQVRAQLATALSLYLAYLRSGSVAEAFPYQHLPNMETYKERLKQAELPVVDGKAYQEIVLEGINAIAHEAREHLAAATKLLTQLPMGATKDEEEAVRAATQEISFQVALAEGYTTYRHATWKGPEKAPSSAAGVTGDDQRFMDACKQGLSKLREAEGKRPNHYLVLEYLGLIYSDPRFDTDNAYLDVAERYLTRAVASKPADYYGNLLLARLLLRRSARRGVIAESEHLVKQALAAQSRSIRTRESQGYLLVLRAELLLLQLELEQDEKARSAASAQLQRDLSQAEALSGEQPAYQWVRALDATRRFDALARSLVDELTKAKLKPAATGQTDAAAALSTQFEHEQQGLLTEIGKVAKSCDDLTPPPVSAEPKRVVSELKRKATKLEALVRQAELATYRGIRIPWSAPP